MKDFQMQDRDWDLSEDQIGKLFPDLKEEERLEAADNFSQYLKVVARIYDRLKEEGKLEEVLLRAQYEKKSRNKSASQNNNQSKDDSLTP